LKGDKMVHEDFNKKLKKVKARSKITPSSRSKTIVVLVVFISIILISFVAYNIYQMEMTKRTQKLKEAKIAAINSIKQMFSSYPNDPYLSIYLTKIEGSDSVEKINKIVEEAASYIEFKKYKEDVINSIKNMYGEYFYESSYAQYIVYKIQKATSKEEVEEILKESNIEENIKMYYIEKIKNKIDPDKYYTIPIFKKKRLMKGIDIINYIKKLSLTELKNIIKELEPVSSNKVAIVVPASQCGKVPLKGSKVEIYNKKNTSEEPIQGVIDFSYLIVENIDYKEVTNISHILQEDSDISILNTTSYINYSLKGIPAVLYATAAGKLDYYQIIEKFGKYGEKFNKIT